MAKPIYSGLSKNDKATAKELANLIMENITQGTINYIEENPEFLSSDEDHAELHEYKEARADAFVDVFGTELTPETMEEFDVIVDAADELVIEKITS